MADVDREPLVEAFASFSTAVAPYVRTTGVTSTYETVRRRKRNHAIAAGAVTALVLAVPTIAYAAAGPHAHRDPQLTATAPTGPAPVVSSTPGPSTKASGSAAKGRISLKALGAATIDVPPWAADASIKGCTAGRMTFHDGAKSVGEYLDITIDKVGYVDVDHDGVDETVARVSCGHEDSTDQVVAFDRTAAGHIRTVGQVAVQAGAVRVLCDFRPGAGGTVDVLVGDFPDSLRCPGDDPAPFMALQWRTYSWTGSAFAQSGGPTSFPANPKVSDLAFDSTNLVFTKAADGSYRGSMTITVRNVGQSAIPYRATVDLPAGLRLVGQPGCGVENDPDSQTVTCQGAAVAAGGTTTMTLEFTSSTSPKLIRTDIIPTADVGPADGYGDLSSTPEKEIRIVS